MNYRTKLNSLPKNISTLPIYEEQGYKIGTAKINGNYVDITIEKYQSLIQKLIEKRLLEVKEVRCSQMNYKEFINESNSRTN